MVLIHSNLSNQMMLIHLNVSKFCLKKKQRTKTFLQRVFYYVNRRSLDQTSNSMGDMFFLMKILVSLKRSEKYTSKRCLSP